jgi:ComF family protein
MPAADPLAATRRLAADVLALVRPPVLAVLRAAADLAVPPACVSCRTPMAVHDTLCPKCWLQVDFIRAPLCDRLGIPMAFGPEEAILSARAAADPPVYDRARAVATHTGLMRDLAHKLKYGDQQHVVPLLSRLMAEAGRELLRDSDLLVPVPLGRMRLWQRSFNQAAVLARAVGKRCGVLCDPMLLERARETPSQVGLTREQRQDNVRGAFKIADGRRGDVRGRKVTLVDDVVTTGATVDAAALTLQQAGAKRVDVLALTLVIGETSWRP